MLEVTVKYFGHELNNKRFSHSFAAAMTQLFDPNARLHQNHYKMPDSELFKLRRTQNEAWRKELQLNGQVDVYCNADERGPSCKNRGWMQAQISAVVDDDDLYLEFPLVGDSFDRKISRWSSDLAPFESKTKEDYEWRRQNLVNAKDFECDAHDKNKWEKATIFEVKKKEINANRVIDLAFVAFRIYRPHNNTLRSDERGTFEGWSNKFDEWVPVFAPRIMPFLSRTQVTEEDLVADEADLTMPKPEEFKEFTVVPRPQICMSSVYIHYLNVFGDMGAIDTIIDVIADDDAQKKYENLDI